MIRLGSISHVFAAALLAFGVCGCANWTNRTTDGPVAELPKLKENSRSLIVEVEFVPIAVDETTPDEIQSLWQWVDETKVDSSLRRDMAANGLRIGRVIRKDRLRTRLQAMQSGEGVLDEFLFQASVASDVSHGGRRIPMRMGRRYEMPVRQPIEGAQVTMARLNGDLVGKTLVDPQFLFAVTPTSGATAQQVNLQLRPEIQHGAMRQKWVASDTALRIDTRRETWSLDELDLNLTGVQGDLYVIGSTSEPVGVGKQMFSGKNNDNEHEQVLMLISLAQVPTPVDQL